MFLAAWEGQPKVMEALINAGANISASAPRTTSGHRFTRLSRWDTSSLCGSSSRRVPTSRGTLPDKNFKEGVVPLKLAKTKKMRKMLEDNGALEEPPLDEPATETAVHEEL